MYKNRTDAGRKLALALSSYKGAQMTVCLGLPRGGIVIAGEVAKELKLPLDLIVPRKIGAPDNPELAIGAVAGEEPLLDRDLIERLGVDEKYIASAIEREKKEAERRLCLYRKNKEPLSVSGWTVLLIDDGIATGSTVRDSIQSLKKQGAAKIVVAVPVGPKDTIEELKKEGVETICPLIPSSFMAVGQFYEDFPQTSDEEVVQKLEEAWKK